MDVASVRAALTAAVSSPDDVLDVLEVLGELCGESQDELTSAWQDTGAGLPWAILAGHCHKAAIDAEGELERRTAWNGSHRLGRKAGEVRL